MTKFEKSMEELENFCQEYGCSKREAMEEIIIIYYETAGFYAEAVQAEVESMGDEELLHAYLIL